MSDTITRLAGIRDALLPAQAAAQALTAELGSDPNTRYGATYASVQYASRMLGNTISDISSEISALRRHGDAS